MTLDVTKCHGGGLEVSVACPSGGGGDCQHHGAEFTKLVTSGSTFFRQPRIDSISDNQPVVQRAITITKKCCVVVNAAMITDTDEIASDFEIERPQGTIRTTQEDVMLSNDLQLHHHAAWEVLTSGTYTYYLMNRSGVIVHPYAAWIKVVASDCEG